MASRGSSAARREPQRRPAQQRRKPVQTQARRPVPRQSAVVPFPAPQQRPAKRPRRRPLSREEAQRRQEQRLRRQALEEESRELARGPVDLPFCLLVFLLTAIGLVMLLSASFPSARISASESPMAPAPRTVAMRSVSIASRLAASPSRTVRSFTDPTAGNWRGASRRRWGFPPKN